MQRASLSQAQLQQAFLAQAQLQGADLRGAQLQGASLIAAELQDAILFQAQLQGADLRMAHVNADTEFASAALCAHDSSGRWWLPRPRTTRYAPLLGDVRWGGVGIVDLTSIEDWNAVDRLGDECMVERRDGADAHQRVVRAYRQLATQLRTQGMTDVADRLSHRALSFERRVFLRQGNILRYLGSWFLAILAGYGYRPLYTIFWYLVVIFGFAFGYYEATHGLLTFGLATSQIHALQWYEALILSVSAFHGRGFFQPVQSLGDPVAILAAIEAIVGLLIEISFIATFTQRVFGSK